VDRRKTLQHESILKVGNFSNERKIKPTPGGKMQANAAEKKPKISLEGSLLMTFAERGNRRADRRLRRGLTGAGEGNTSGETRVGRSYVEGQRENGLAGTNGLDLKEWNRRRTM